MFSFQDDVLEPAPGPIPEPTPEHTPEPKESEAESPDGSEMSAAEMSGSETKTSEDDNEDIIPVKVSFKQLVRFWTTYTKITA